MFSKADFCLMAIFFAGCTLPSPKPNVVSKVEDTRGFERGQHIEFTGVAVTSIMGEHRWRHRGGNSYVPDPSKPHPQAIWVVPVVNPGDAVPQKEVQMWVAAPHSWTKLYQKPQPWFDKLKADFDNKTIQENILGTAGGPSTWTKSSASWEKAIQDVTTRTGLTTPADAVVVMWPPKEILPPSP